MGVRFRFQALNGRFSVVVDRILIGKRSPRSSNRILSCKSKYSTLRKVSKRLWKKLSKISSNLTFISILSIRQYRPVSSWRVFSLITHIRRHLSFQLMELRATRVTIPANARSNQAAFIKVLAEVIVEDVMRPVKSPRSSQPVVGALLCLVW